MDELVVGQEYALAAPGSSYERDFPTRARVVALNVHGKVYTSTWLHSRRSNKADYVEYEVVGSASGRGVKHKHHFYHAPGQFVLRARPSFFWMPWAEYAEHAEKQKRFLLEKAEREGAEEARVDKALEVLARLGVRAWGSRTRLGNGDLLTTFGVEDLETIARFVNIHRPPPCPGCCDCEDDEQGWAARERCHGRGKR